MTERELQNHEVEFQAIFGEGYKPYRFQSQVAEHLLNGRNVILQAPTGAGKTEAALFPYLWACREGLNFPRKLLYSVPMRVLAKSFYDRLTSSPAINVNTSVSIQTSEQQDDRQLKGNIIFTTIDQLLSGFLNIPYALGRRQANVNAGAVASSYLVFDEFHLFDPDTMLPTTIQILKMLDGITPWLLMTATFSEPLLNRLAAWLNAKVVKVSQDEVFLIPSQKNKRRVYCTASQSLLESTESVINRHSRRSLVICNTVARAQAMYRQLSEALQRSDTAVILLHSRFFKADRRQKEDSIIRRFGKDAVQENVILVSTQVIEVGLDITCETLHTEVAPASAIFQRAGRCARFKDESGTVIVYPAPQTERGEPNYHPYAELGQLCESTFSAFQSRNECVLDFHAEQEVINEVHWLNDEQVLDTLSALPTRRRISDCISGIRYEMSRELIRKKDSLTVLLTTETPESLSDPFQVEGFSLYRGTLHSQWRSLSEQAKRMGLNWILKYPVEAERENLTSGNSRTIPTYDWQAITAEDSLGSLPSTLFVVHPRLAAYDDQLGFRFEADGMTSLPATLVTPRQVTVFHSRFSCETYTQHIQHLMHAYMRELRDELAYAAARLEAKMCLSPGTFERAIKLSIALHDVGKLTEGWQRWAHEWQALIGQPVDENYMVAHTDYDGTNADHRIKEKQMKTLRPPHAVESMRAVANMLTSVFGQSNRPLISAILTAIARHHSPNADQYQPYRLHPEAGRELGNVLKTIDPGAIEHLNKLQSDGQPRSLTNIWVQPDDTLPLLAYFFIVRALRLADQWATEQTSREAVTNVSANLLCR